jgi:hypothetical protein
MATRDNYKITRTQMVSPKKEHELQNRPGGSNIGEYSGVSDDNFAGNACGLPGAYPINTIERARAALAYAHNAKDPECIRRQVYKKYPSLRHGKQ